MSARFTKWFSLSLVVLALPLGSAGTAGAEIAPPWCGTPMPDAAAALPDGSSPSHPAGSFPHIPYYAIGCTLERIAADSNGRMTVAVVGQSALGRDLYGVTINALETPGQRAAFANWQKLRRQAMHKPAKAQRDLARFGGVVKVPLFVQGGIHGGEFEGVDSVMRTIEKLATKPYGADPEVDAILDGAILVFNPVQNPDGRIGAPNPNTGVQTGVRQNGNGFDLNRDYLTQAQPETKASVSLMQEWLPPEVLDLHGYVTPTLIEATTKPHNPSIEYDLWLKWNQGRIDANEVALNAVGLAVTRPINDWCADGSIPEGGVCEDGTTRIGPRWAESWDDWGPFYTAMYAQHVGLNASTVEMCNQPDNTRCGVPGSTSHPRGRFGSLVGQNLTTWSTLLYDVKNRVELMHDHFEIYERGVEDAPRPDCCPPPFDVDNNWMHEYPQAYVIPVGRGQRSDAEANRLVEWLLFNGVEVSELDDDYRLGSQKLKEGAYVVSMAQARRGLIDTALGVGVDISDRISILYAPPGAWSHGALWGADVLTVPDGVRFRPETEEIRKPNKLKGGVEHGKANAYLLEMDSPTAVRTLNQLLGSGVTAGFTMGAAGGLPAGSAIFASDRATKAALDRAGKANGLTFRRLTGPLPATEPIDRVPRIAVLTGAVNQDVWTLRNLGFQADPVSVATINSSFADPLVNYDVVFNTGSWPSAANATARSRLTSFFAGGGGYIGAGVNGARFLADGGQVAGLTASSRGGNGRSGIVVWDNVGGASSPIVGAYPSRDTAIMDPPTWFTGIPASMSVDGRFPSAGFFLAGLWALDSQSASAPGSPVIAHGTNTAGSARLASFAMNPLYRADPEREWPMIGSAAYWADQ